MFFVSKLSIAWRSHGNGNIFSRTRRKMMIDDDRKDMWPVDSYTKTFHVSHSTQPGVSIAEQFSKKIAMYVVECQCCLTTWNDSESSKP